MIQAKKESWFLKNVLEVLFLILIVFLIRTFGFGLYQVPTGSMETTMLVGERFFADKFTYLFRAPRAGEIIAFNDILFDYSDNKLNKLFQRYVYGPQNVTKRIIGEPRDIVQGMIEEGRPVIYVNNKKIAEPYLNKYPLITVYTDDKNVLLSQIDRDLSGLLRGRAVDPLILDTLRMQRLSAYTKRCSYDPSVPYEHQPFYAIKPSRVVTGLNGEQLLIYPGTILPPSIARVERGESYWNGSDEFYIELADDEYWVMGDNRLGSKDSRWFGPIKREDIHGRILGRIWSSDSSESWWIVDLLKHPIEFWKRIRWDRFFQVLS